MMELVLLLAAPIGLVLFRRFRLDDSGRVLPLVGVLKPAGLAGLIGLAIFALYAVGGEYVIALAFGEAFSPAAGLLTVLASSLVIALANGVLFQALLAVGMERWCALGATFAALFNVSANLLFLPRHGVMAAAWITVATEVVVGLFLLYGLSLRRRA
jgi:O-antigen/teichoic acid export membrane protein